MTWLWVVVYNVHAMNIEYTEKAYGLVKEKRYWEKIALGEEIDMNLSFSNMPRKCADDAYQLAYIAVKKAAKKFAEERIRQIDEELTQLGVEL